MNVVPKRYDVLGFLDEEIRLDEKVKLRVIFATGSRGEPSGLWVECRAIYPDSALGRTVHLFLEDDVSEALMKLCRERAVQRRSEPLSEPRSPAPLSEPQS